MPTGYEINMYRDLTRIAKSLTNVAETLERIAELQEQQAELQARIYRGSVTPEGASAEAPERVR